MAVTPHRLDGDDRGQACQRIAAARPGIAKYQARSGRVYPVVPARGGAARGPWSP